MSIRNILVASLVLLLNSCANIVPPSGGPVDPNPPQLKSQYPAQGSTNFKGDKIVLEFDEYLAPIGDISAIIISPRMNKDPEITVRKRKITLHFTEALQASTTYTINFAETIKDNQEGNPLRNFTVVFSTGPYIDSGSIKGSVVDANTLAVQKDMTVMLFSDLSDSAPFKQKPSYISRTDLNGLYSFSNLPPQNFRIYALADANRNLLPDHDEAFAFQKELVRANADSSKAIKLFSSPFKKKQEVLITRNRRQDENTYVFGFNQDIRDSLISIVPSLQVQGSVLEKMRTESDTVRFYYYPSVKTDSIQLNVLAGKRLLGSYTYAFPKIPGSAFNLSSNISQSKPGDTIIINSAQAIKSIDKSNIEIIEEERNRVSFATIQNGNNPNQFYLLFEKKEGYKYSIIIADSSIQSIYNNYNRRFKSSINISEEKRYGSLSFTLKNEDGKSLIVMLLDKDAKLIRSYYAKTELQVQESWISPGDYMLKVIWDKNGNNRFDLADYESSTQTEPVFIYPDNIVIKSNWEVSGLRISPVFE